MLFLYPYIMVVNSSTKFSGNNGALEEIDNVRPSSSCSRTGDRNYDGEEQNHVIEITDESEIHGEIDRQLNETNTVPVSILFCLLF